MRRPEEHQRRLAGVRLLDVDEPLLPADEQILLDPREPPDRRVAGEQHPGRRRAAGADLEHPDQRLAAGERAVDRRQVGDHQRHDAEPDRGLEERECGHPVVLGPREAERRRRRSAEHERLAQRLLVDRPVDRRRSRR